MPSDRSSPPPPFDPADTVEGIPPFDLEELERDLRREEEAFDPRDTVEGIPAFDPSESLDGVTSEAEGYDEDDLQTVAVDPALRPMARREVSVPTEFPLPAYERVGNALAPLGTPVEGERALRRPPWRPHRLPGKRGGRPTWRHAAAVAVALAGLGVGFFAVSDPPRPKAVAAVSVPAPEAVVPAAAPPVKVRGLRAQLLATPRPPSTSSGRCEPKSCIEQALECGAASDGCGGTVQCGGCGGGLECGAAGTPNKCAFKCEPMTCKELLADCGEVDDGCGHTIQCGQCKGGETCGGGGAPNACGKETCRPFTCRERALSGGRFSDGCASVLEC